MAAIAARLTVANSPLFDGVTVLTEDAQDLETQINKAIGEIGMLILIGEPSWTSDGQARRVATGRVASEIAIGEMPTLWRTDNSKPRAQALATEVIRQVLGLAPKGFTPIELERARLVPHKTRHIWEVVLASQLVFWPDAVVRTP